MKSMSATIYSTAMMTWNQVQLSPLESMFANCLPEILDHNLLERFGIQCISSNDDDYQSSLDTINFDTTANPSRLLTQRNFSWKGRFVAWRLDWFFVFRGVMVVRVYYLRSGGSQFSICDRNRRATSSALRISHIILKLMLRNTQDKG